MISPIQSQDATLVPPLRDGDRLTMQEFERPWDAMPNLKRAELIDGEGRDIMIAPTSSTLTNRIPPLANGDHLTADEFCRRWNAMPELKHAELLGGRVYMNPPISAESHSLPHGRIVVWLWHYAIATDGTQFFDETSAHFGPGDLPQPDAVLRIKESHGGNSRLIRGDLHGAPELIVEVSSSSERRDLGIKKQRYAANGVQEYLIWLVAKRKFVWFSLQEGEYVELEQLRSGIVKSRVFPGLWLDTKGMLADNWPKILATLRNGMESPESVEFAKRLKSQGRKKRKS